MKNFLPCEGKGIWTALDSGLHAVDSGFQELEVPDFVSGTWIFESLGGFRIPKAKMFGFDPDSTSKNFQDSHHLYYMSGKD